MEDKDIGKNAEEDMNENVGDQIQDLPKVTEPDDSIVNGIYFFCCAFCAHILRRCAFLI